MIDTPADQFMLTLPLFALASNYTIADNGLIVLDEHIRFIAPEMQNGQFIAVFTDHDLASAFLADTTRDPSIRILCCDTPANLKNFLDRIQSNHEYIVVDLNPKTRIGRLLLISDILDQMAAMGQASS